MDDQTIDAMEQAGWTTECISPFEMRHTDGSFATLQAAIIVRDHVLQDNNFSSEEED